MTTYRVTIEFMVDAEDEDSVSIWLGEQDADVLQDNAVIEEWVGVPL